MLNKLLQLTQQKAELQTRNETLQGAAKQQQERLVRAESRVDQLLKQNAQLMDQLRVGCE